MISSGESRVPRTARFSRSGVEQRFSAAIALTLNICHPERRRPIRSRIGLRSRRIYVLRSAAIPASVIPSEEDRPAGGPPFESPQTWVPRPSRFWRRAGNNKACIKRTSCCSTRERSLPRQTRTRKARTNFVNFPLRCAESGGINDKPSRTSVASRADGFGCEFESFAQARHQM